MTQLDIHEVLDLVAEEEAYERAERAGRQLDSQLCPECPDPALCQAERYCPKGEA